MVKNDKAAQNDYQSSQAICIMGHTCFIHNGALEHVWLSQITRYERSL